MNIDKHKMQLGALLSNFQSLEFMLRGFLQAQPTARPFDTEYENDIYGFPVGTELQENEFTNYDSLSVLITKFNNEMNKRGLPLIDPDLVEIRDALAHGRVSSATPNDHLRLIKFDRPVNGKVRVVFNEKMTDSWFSLQIKRVFEAIKFVNSNMEP